MHRRIERLITAAFDAYSLSGNDRMGFYDLTLSMLAWNALSEYATRTDSALYKILLPPGQEFFFNDIMRQIGHPEHKFKVEKALWEWERKNDQLLKGLLQIESNQIKDIPDEAWQRISTLWCDFFNLSSEQGDQDVSNIILTIDHLEDQISKARLGIVTPKELSRIMVDLLNDNNNTSLYDPYGRCSELLSAAARKMGKLKRIHGLLTGRLPWKMGKLRLLLLGLPAKIEIDMGFEQQYPRTTTKFDTIICNPPFGIYRQDQHYRESLVEGEWSWLANRSNRSDFIYLCHVLDHLSEKGRAAIIVPTIFLSGQGGMKELRKRIIQQNILDAVITLPPGIFPQTGVFTAILIFNKDRKNDKVFMLDAAKLAVKEGKQVYLEETKIDEFIQQFKEQQYNSNEHTRVLTTTEIEAHDFDLQFSVYDISDDLFIKELIPAAKILDDCKSLEDELKQVSARIATLLASR